MLLSTTLIDSGLSESSHGILTIRSAPGLVFWFADADAASATTYPPTTFRWIDNQKEAEEAVEAAKKKAAKRAAGEE